MATFVRTQEIEHEVGERGSVILRVTSPDVQMTAVPGTTRARVVVTFEIRAASETHADDAFDRVRFRAQPGPGALEILEPHSTGGALASLASLLGGGGGSRVDVRVEVEAPPAATVSYEGVSADLTATGFRGTQHYRTVSGDMVLDRIGGETRIRGVSSDISLRADVALTALEIQTVSGDISAAAPRVGQLRIVTVSGDVELESVFEPGSHHRVETVSGDLSLGIVGGLSLEVRGLSSDVDVRMAHRSEGSRDRRRYIIGDGGPALLFSSMSGDVEVRAARRGDVLLTPPKAPTPPTPATPPTPPTPPTPAANDVLDDAGQLEVLRALERGEIDVDEAGRRLAGEGQAPG